MILFIAVVSYCLFHFNHQTKLWVLVYFCVIFMRVSLINSKLFPRINKSVLFDYLKSSYKLLELSYIFLVSAFTFSILLPLVRVTLLYLLIMSFFIRFSGELRMWITCAHTWAFHFLSGSFPWLPFTHAGNFFKYTPI